MADIELNGQTYLGINKVVTPTNDGNQAMYGTGISLGTKTITQNGEYIASNDGYDGWSDIVVNTGTVVLPTTGFVRKSEAPLNTVQNGLMYSLNDSSTSLDFTGANTSYMTNMYNMFSGFSSLTSLNVTSFNTTNVTNMGSMFNGCSNLTTLDLSNFNTSNVIDMSGMFYWCTSLSSLDIRNFDFSNLNGNWSYWNMLDGIPSTCKIYVNQEGYNWLLDKYNNGNGIKLADPSMLEVVYTLQDGLYYYSNYFYIRFDTANQTFTGQNDTQPYSGTYTRSGNTLTLTYGAYSNTQIFIILSDITIGRYGESYIYTYQPEQ